MIIGKEEKPAPAPVAELEPAAEDDPKAMKIREFLEGLMEHLNVQATPDIYRSETGYKVILQGHGLGAIIGRRGETLDAIQQLTNYSVNRGQSKRVRIHIDAEGYRAKREESLQRLAVKVAGKVVKYRKNMTLEPMNAYERHVIHAALQNYPNVTTYSTGVEPNRRTVVAYAPQRPVKTSISTFRDSVSQGPGFFIHNFSERMWIILLFDKKTRCYFLRAQKVTKDAPGGALPTSAAPCACAHSQPTPWTPGYGRRTPGK